MFNAKQAISEWREQLARRGIRSPEVLDELESHLCDKIRDLVSAGIPEAEAFRRAVSELGDTKSVAAEFQKISHGSSIAGLLRILFGSGLVLALATVLFGLRLPGKPSLMLMAHILALTVGDILAFFAGSLGICYVLNLGFRRLSCTEQRSLSRAAAIFNQLSACLILAGLLFGMIWSQQNGGHYFSGDPRETGTFCAALWFVIFCLVWRFGRLGIHATMLLCVAGNFIILLAWFGAGLVSHSYGIGSAWQLNLAMGINLVVLVSGLAAGDTGSERNTAHV